MAILLGRHLIELSLSLRVVFFCRLCLFHLFMAIGVHMCMLDDDMARPILSGNEGTVKTPLQIHFYALTGVRALHFYKILR